ncbi:MAG TPA: TonB-dependent receptor [Vicinamibacterales bacterium]|nr:TonB-dependent receptor [Vicinamibacterales bacterium]
MPVRRSRNAISNCIRLACGLLAFYCPPADAQSLSLAGRVSDTTGAPLPGVSVQLRTPDARQRVETVTDVAGKYRLDVRESRQYQLSFSLMTFGRVTKTITAAASDTIVDAVLPLAFTADVTVTGRRTFRNIENAEDPARNLIGLASAASEGAVTAKQLENRPLQRPGEVLEAVPGLVISQHSGEGKANQYYLRGFNLDHGTDFAVSVAGVPVNMPTHAHGQGWSDVNFLIPELVSGVQFKKGPYYAEEGDFSTAGAANINYVGVLERPLVRLTAGGDRFGRFLAAASPRLGPGHLLVAVETGHNDGPWQNPERYRRLNGVVRYSQGDTRQGSSITAMAYDARWTATDQIPRRAIDKGLISRFGTLDGSDGGKTHRFTLSADVQRSGPSSTTKVVGYFMDYGLDLFSNFTYQLNDSVNGDQFEQVDDRRVFGGRASHRRQSLWAGRTLEHNMGVQLRHDEIGALGLYATRERQRLTATREDRVRQTSIGMYYQGELAFTDRLRATAGLRGDLYRFRVRSTRPENAGTDLAGLLSPKLGVVFAPSGKLELYGNFGYGYHSNDGRGATMSVDPMTGTRVEPVTPLVRTRGGELGLRTILIPKVQTTVAVWGLSLDSELVFVGDAGTTEPGRPSRRSGVEWASSYSPRPWLSFDADVSWSSARFTDGGSSGSAIPGAVRQVASVGASVSEHHRISAGLRLRYLGPRPLVEDATVTSTRSLVVNMEAGYRIAPRTRIVVDVLNLFNSSASDIEYYYASRLAGEPSGGRDDIHTHPLQPRTARIGVQVEF